MRVRTRVHRELDDPEPESLKPSLGVAHGHVGA